MVAHVAVAIKFDKEVTIMATNTQSRKWMLTINNPQACELDHERIREILSLFSPDYFCMADEIATTGTYHTHIFLYFFAGTIP